MVLENKSGPWDAGERNCSELKLGNKRRNRKRGKKIIALKASLLPRDSAEQSTKLRFLALCAPPGALLGTSCVLQASSPAAFKSHFLCWLHFYFNTLLVQQAGQRPGSWAGFVQLPGREELLAPAQGWRVSVPQPLSTPRDAERRICPAFEDSCAICIQLFQGSPSPCLDLAGLVFSVQIIVHPAPVSCSARHMSRAMLGGDRAHAAPHGFLGASTSPQGLSHTDLCSAPMS